MRIPHSFLKGLALLFFIPQLSLAQSDTFYVSRNAFFPGKDTVSIDVTVSNFPNDLSLRIYNSAGELVKTLDKTSPLSAYSQNYTWDGTNVHGDKVASGVYLIRLKTANYVRVARILAIR